MTSTAARQSPIIHRWADVTERGGGQSAPLPICRRDAYKGDNMTSAFVNGEPHAFEPHASIARLSAAKRSALCLIGDGALHKQRGVWVPDGGSATRIADATVKSLVRDGMLILTVHGRKSSARLTGRGKWFARALLTETMEPEAQDVGVSS
jgi:hypothetical protein